MNKEIISGIVTLLIGISVIFLGVYLNKKNIPIKVSLFVNQESYDKTQLPADGQGFGKIAPFIMGGFFCLMGLFIIAIGTGNQFLLKLFAGLIFISAGIGIIVLMSFLFGSPQRTQKWLSAPGIIKAMSAPTTDELISGKVKPDSALAKIEYEYQVKGKTYRADRLTLSDATKTPGYTQLIRNNYPVGKEITVYFDPADPNSAVLKHEQPQNIFKAVGYYSGAMFILMGLLAMFIPANK